MLKIICSTKGNKLAQQPNCECQSFNLFVNSKDEVVAKCSKCGTLFTIDSLKKANSPK